MDNTKRFNEICCKFIKDKINEEKTIRSSHEKKVHKLKYPFLHRKYKLPFYFELLKYTERL